MKKIGIIGAMELEVDTLKSKMNVKSTTTRARMEFVEGTLNGVEVVVVRIGIGKVNAGMCTQILADLFGVTHIKISYHTLSEILWVTITKLAHIRYIIVVTFKMTIQTNTYCHNYSPFV